MAISSLESDTVSRGAAVAKKIVEDIKPVIDRLNILYDATTVGVKYTLTQAELDSVSSFSGITKQQVDDGMYALTATLKTAIDNAYTALVQLAGRS